MPLNLFLNLDHELEAEIRRTAGANGRTAEEEIRKRLIENMGSIWQPLTPEDIINDDRVNVMLDLRTKPHGGKL